MKKDPLDPEANWLAYECLKGQLRYEEAFAQLKRMATFPYEDARVYRELGMHYLNNEQRPQLALQMFAKSLGIDSDQPEIQQLVAKLRQQGANPGPPSAAAPSPPDPKSLIPALPSPQIPTPGL